MTKSKTCLAALAALLALGCGETATGNGGSGGGPTIEKADQLCREFCANEEQGPDCGPKQNESVETCYKNCIDGYSRQVSSPCPDEGFDICYDGPVCPDEWWAANYDCYLSVDCNDQFGDCNGLAAKYGECTEAFRAMTPAWCEANCPEDEVCGRFASGFGSRLCGVALP